jgi:cytochrome c556
VYQKLTEFVKTLWLFDAMHRTIDSVSVLTNRYEVPGMKKLLLVLSMIGLSASVTFADPLEDREAAMKGLGKAVGMIAPIAKGEAPFDAAAVSAAFAAMNESAQKIDVSVMFPDGSTGESASPEIWKNLADFQAKMDKLKADTAAAVAAPAADLAALQAQFGAVTQNCGACHELYRVKKG